MKTIFFTGKGGVGKSTLSAAAAWQLMEKGNRVLAVSFDPAHNLGDIFNVKLSNKKKRFKKTELYLQETDLEKSASEYIQSNIDLLKQVYSYLTTLNFESYFEVLKYSPGVEEYAALTSLEKILKEEKDNFDYIVFDTPPTGLTLRILALPQITISWVDRLIKIRKQILEKRYTIHKLTGKYDEKGTKLPYTEEEDNVIQNLYNMKERYKAVETFIQGNDSLISVVFNPDYLSLRESERLLEGIHDLKLTLGTAFNNKFTDEKSEIAEGVEKELVKQYPELSIERVTLYDNKEKETYIIEKDLIQKFQEKLQHG